MKTTLRFQTPPSCGGQIVERSYATTEDGYVIRRTVDRADGTSVYDISRARVDDSGDYWQQEPGNKRWRRLTAEEMG